MALMLTIDHLQLLGSLFFCGRLKLVVSYLHETRRPCAGVSCARNLVDECTGVEPNLR